MGEGLVRLVRYCGMKKIVGLKSRSWILNAVQQHASSADTCDSYFAFRIKPASPFDRIHEQFPESAANGLPHILGEIRFERGQKTLDAIRDFELARNQQLNPVRLRRDDLN